MLSMDTSYLPKLTAFLYDLRINTDLWETSFNIMKCSFRVNFRYIPKIDTDVCD